MREKRQNFRHLAKSNKVTYSLPLKMSIPPWQLINFVEMDYFFYSTFSFSQGQRATLNEQRTARTAGTAFVK